MTQSDEEFWKVKIIAFLHDPPTKPWDLSAGKSHENTALANIRCVLGNEEALEVVKNADREASGADRPPIKSEIKVNKVSAIHPVSGEGGNESLEIIQDLDGVEEKIRENLLSAFREVAPNLKERYLLLWRFLPYLCYSVINEDSLRIPADTRWCDHSLWDHLDLTSAIAGAMERDQDRRYAVIYVKIPGPQRFIQGSRKFSELWGASYLISRIMMEIVGVISEEHGPDAVIFPSLRGNPMFDYYFFIKNNSRRELVKKLFEKVNGKLEGELTLNFGEFYKRSVKGARHSLLPNKLIAIVPADDVQNLERSIKEAVKKFLDEALEKTKKSEKIKADLLDRFDEESAKKILAERFYPRFLYLIPAELFKRDSGFPKLEALEKAIDRKKLEIREIYEKIQEYYKKSKEFMEAIRDEPYPSRPLIFYEVYRKILEEMERREARIQKVPKLDVEGEACHLCGENPAVYKVEYRGPSLKLCPICLLKMSMREIADEEIKPRYLSHITLSMLAFAKKLKAEEGEKELIERIIEIVEKIEELLKRKGIESKEISEIKTQIENNKSLEKAIFAFDKKFEIEALLGILTGDSYLVGKAISESLTKVQKEENKEEIAKKIEEDIREEIRNDVLEVRKKLEELRKKSGRNVPVLESLKYSSFILFDGDYVGMLLSRKVNWNSSRKLLNFAPRGVYFSRYIEIQNKSIKKRKEWGELKKVSAVPSPLYHRQISSALTNFILYILDKLKKLEEEKGVQSFIIYAGGDDFAIVADPLHFDSIVEELSKGINERLIELEEEWIKNGKNSLARFKITLPAWRGSAGVTLFYFKKPFYQVIELTREMEERAKEFRKEKCCVGLAVLLGSGISEKVVVPNILRKKDIGLTILKVEEVGIRKLLEEELGEWREEKEEELLKKYAKKAKTAVKGPIKPATLRNLVYLICYEESEEDKKKRRRKLKEILEADIKEILRKHCELKSRNSRDEKKKLVNLNEEELDFFAEKLQELIKRAWKKRSFSRFLYSALRLSEMYNLEDKTEYKAYKDLLKREVWRHLSLSKEDGEVLWEDLFELFEKMYGGESQHFKEFLTALKALERVKRWRGERV